MKKLIKYGLAIFMIAIIGFWGCEKESEYENPTTNQINEEKSDIEVLYYSNSKSNNTNILHFKDGNIYGNIVEQLKNDLIQHDLDFNEQYSNLNIEELNNKVDDIGFKEFTPLENFVKELGFESKITEYITYEDEWLKQDELISEDSPEEKFNDINVEELTLLNQDYAVIIGTSIFIKLYDGVIKIREINFDTLNEISQYDSVYKIDENSFSNINIFPTKVIEEKNTNESCYSHGHNYVNKDVDSDYVVKTKIKFNRTYNVWYGEYRYHFSSYTKTYKKKWWGYKKYKFNKISVDMGGKYRLRDHWWSDCDATVQYMNVPIKWGGNSYSVEYDEYFTTEDSYYFGVKHNEIWGNHYYKRKSNSTMKSIYHYAK